MINITKDILKDIYKARPENVRKYDYGLVLVIGGSEFYSGSPALNAFAAFSAGADMVRVIAPKRPADIIASFSPILAAYPLHGDHLQEEHLACLISMTESAKTVSNGRTAVIIGGGVGRSEETQQVILQYLEQVSVPVVIDADAIHALAEKPEIIAGKKFLITPHTYEFFILTKKEIYKLSDEEKVKFVESEAKRLNTTILLKGKTDIISNGKEVALNTTGSPLMTKGGMGDTLAGIAGALLARGVDIFTAASAAAYINGLAGNLAAKKFGESVTAMDLVESIVEVFKNNKKLKVKKLN